MKYIVVSVLSLIAIGCQAKSSYFSVKPQVDIISDPQGVSGVIRFTYEIKDEPGIVKTGLTAYCRDGLVNNVPVSNSYPLVMPKPGWITNKAAVGKPPELDYFTVDYPGAQKVLEEVCKLSLSNK
jgi:hypothetical protein